MYTEMIFGCKLSKSTPKECINALNYSINGAMEDWDNLSEEDRQFHDDYDLGYLFHGSSYYFGVNLPVNRFWRDNIDNCWHISVRSNIKNYEGQIENFLDYIADYVEQGSGYGSHVYAYVQYEEDALPTIYSLEGKYELNDLLHDELVKRELV